MSIFSRLFGRTQSQDDYGDEEIKKVLELIGCDYTFLSRKMSREELTKLYFKEYKKGRTEGYTPIIVYMDTCLMEIIEASFDNIDDYRNYHNRMCSISTDGGRSFLQKRFAEIMQLYKSDHKLKEIIYGEFDDTVSPLVYFSSVSYDNSQRNKAILKVPITEPWMVFAWIPFGGWNECPADEDIMSVCKYWYEEYNVVPAVISGDTLQMYCFDPIKDKNTALRLAEEQYAFCNDSVDQGAENIKRLASSLIHSNVWYFWWD